MGRGGVSSHLGAYRVILRLLPAWFREEYGDEMIELFRARLARRRGVASLVGLWWSTAKDTLTTAVALRRSPPLGRRGSQEGMGMEALWQDIRYAVRHLVRSPAFTAGAVGILAVGIGANATVFSLVDAMLFRPPPWERPEEVVHVYQDSDDGDGVVRNEGKSADSQRSIRVDPKWRFLQIACAWTMPRDAHPGALRWFGVR